MYDIGIDLGTSAVKLLLLDERAKVLRTVSRSYPLEFPHPGWSQQNPEDWWSAIAEGVPALLEGFDPAQVAGIGVAGQMHGLVALDEAGKVLRPAILWNDGRTAAQTERLNADPGRDFLLDHTGNIAFPGFTAPKLLWMREEEPELFDRLAMALLPKDYVNFRLTGSYSTDYSDAAGTLLLDVEHKRWSPEMLALCGLTEAQLPALHESWEIVGSLTGEAAKALGLREGVTVVAGAGDNAAAAVGTGTLREGQCNLSLGTSGTVFLPCDRFLADRARATHAFNHANGRYHLMGCMLSAASCLKWWVEEVCRSQDYTGLQGEIDEAALGRNRVFFLPYLMGERAPHNDPYAAGCFLGMRMDSRRADFTQAVLEGVAFGFRDMVESARALGLPVKASRLCGGGAKSAVWKRILANVLNLRLELLEEEQGPGMGGALLSAVGRGQFPSLEDAAGRCVNIVGCIDPEPELTALYEERYQQFRKLYPALKEVFRELK